MNSREIEQAVVDNQNLVRFAINRYFPGLCDDEDIFQVGWIGLWRACIGYDSSRSKFSTYAVRCIINEIRVELRNRAKLWGFGEIASLDEPMYFDKDGNAITLANLIPDPNNDYCKIDYELFVKVSQREERVDRIKAFLIFPVATFHLTIMSGSVRANQFMLDTQLSGGFLKKGLNIPFTVGKTVSKFKAVVSLDTFHANAPAGIPLHQPLQKVGESESRSSRRSSALMAKSKKPS